MKQRGYAGLQTAPSPSIIINLDGKDARALRLAVGVKLLLGRMLGNSGQLPRVLTGLEKFV